MRMGVVACWVMCGWAVACSSQQVAGNSAADAAAGVDATAEVGASGAGGASGQAGVAGAAGRGGDGGGAGAVQDAGPPGGPVSFSSVFNARETGGLPTASGQLVRRNVLIRSGHLADLDATGCQQLSTLGIRSVVDLRAASAASGQPDAACVSNDTAYYLADLPKILPPSDQSYAQTLDAAEPKLAAIYEHLGKPGAMPAIVHCVIGRDRASMLTALLLLSLGVPQEDVVNDFVSNQDASVTVDAAWLQPLLDRLDAAGGVEKYLQSHGVTQGQIEQLRTMALQ